MFRRRKAAESSAEVDGVVVDEVSDEAGGLKAAADEIDEDGSQSSAGAAAPPFDRSNGPFDESEVSADDEARLDLGALRLPTAPGMEVRVEVNKATSVIMAITAIIKDSELQLTAFAAPRSGGLWDEIREEIATAVTKGDGTAEVVDGPLGRELRVRRPAQGPGGRTVFAPSRFIGVDGPRWFLRGVLGGRAAIDEAAAAPLLDVYRRTVVVRGADPMGPREMLPLVLPPSPATSEATAASDAEETPEPDAGGSLDPFERGPEITQVG